MERAVAVAPDSGEAQLALGLALLDAGEANAAVDHLERSAQLLANTGTFVAIGNAELSRGDEERAIAAYRRALAWQPASFAANLNLAEALRRRGDLAAAAAALARARALYPHHPKLLAADERLRRTQADALD